MAQTFAPEGIDIVAACIAAFIGLVLVITRGGSTPAGFSERARLKYGASMLGSVITLGVFYLCTALGNHHFGHTFMGGLWIPTGMWLAFAFANVLNAYATGMAFSANEAYAWVNTFLEVVISAFLYLGAESAENHKVVVALGILAIFFFLVQGWYFVYYCTPSPEWQASHGGATYTWYRLTFWIVKGLYIAFYFLDVTYANVFHGSERDPWIAYLIFSSFVVHGVHVLLINLYFNTEPLPPVGIWRNLTTGASVVGANPMPGAMVMEQNFVPNPAVDAAGGSDGQAVPDAQESKYHFQLNY